MSAEITENKKRDVWDKLSSLSGFIASVLVPIVIALVGHSYTSAIKEAENRVRYTELAISILKEDPEKDRNDVREWAVDVINQYSGVPMSANVRQQLIGTRLIQSDFRNSNFLESNFRGSNFLRSSFSYANFNQSLFVDASFREARFPGADLRGADLSGAIVDDSTKLPRR